MTATQDLLDEMNKPISAKPEVPTGRALLRLMRAHPWRYAVNLILWIAIVTMPLIPGLITKEFFDRLDMDPAGLNVGTLIAILAVYAVTRLVVVFHRHGQRHHLHIPDRESDAAQHARTHVFRCRVLRPSTGLQAR